MLVVIQVFPPNTTLPIRLTIAKVPTNQTQVGAPFFFFLGSPGFGGTGSCGFNSLIGFFFRYLRTV
jgi:hypothetical protein